MHNFHFFIPRIWGINIFFYAWRSKTQCKSTLVKYSIFVFLAIFFFKFSFLAVKKWFSKSLEHFTFLSVFRLVFYFFPTLLFLFLVLVFFCSFFALFARFFLFFTRQSPWAKTFFLLTRHSPCVKGKKTRFFTYFLFSFFLFWFWFW